MNKKKVLKISGAIIIVVIFLFVLLLILDISSHPGKKLYNIEEELLNCNGEASCYINVAANSKDYTVCSRIVVDVNQTLWRNYCYAEYVRMTDSIDSSICENIIEEDVHRRYLKDSCKNSILRNKNENILQKAVEENNPNLCETVFDSSEDFNKIDQCYYDFAILVDSVEYCDRIKDVSSKEWCLIKVSNNLKEEDCEKMNESRIDNCYLGIVKLKLESGGNVDSSFCDKISSSMEKESCYFNIAVGLNISSLCEKVNSMSKPGCYSKIAISTKNIDLCENILDKYFYSECILKLS